MPQMPTPRVNSSTTEIMSSRKSSGGEEHRDQPAPLDRKMQGDAGELIGDATDALVERQNIGGSVGHP